MLSSMRSRQIRKKYEEEEAHMQYLLSRGWHPFKIADHITQNMIILLREGIQKRFPKWDDSQIL